MATEASPRSVTRTATSTPSRTTPALTPTQRRGKGLSITRRFTTAGVDPFDTVRWERRNSRIRDEAGNSIFELKDVEVPSSWDQVATDVVVSKYFRRAGVPVANADGTPRIGPDGKPLLGGETSVRQPITRLARAWRWWGEKYGYFASKEDAVAFEDEIRFLLVHQMASPNSPQWFNTGIALAYGVKGEPQGHWYVDQDTGELRESEDSYTRSQAHACFIQGVKDSMMEEGGIYDLVKKEARIFKFGSGTGTNFSTLRAEGEPVSAGGTASGLMSWLTINDRSAGAIKSGGATRRSAKMVILNVDHPDVEKFVWWKAQEEKKVAALVAAGYPSDFNGEAYQTVSGQNSNNSVRVPNEFLRAVEADGDWRLRWRTDPSHVSKTLKARQLWRQIAEAAWQSADPGLQYDTTIQEWHTCPASGRINATNPCCVTGDTLVAVADGRNAVPIKNLVGQEVPVYVWDHAKGRTTIRRMWNIGVKRQDAPVFRVTLDDGSSFRATDDHLIMLRDGTYRQVKDLQAGDSLMPLHSKVRQNAGGRTPRRFVSTGHGWRVQYRWIWEQAFGQRQPAGFHLHHQNFDSLDDRLGNLTLIPESEHADLHRVRMLGDRNPARRLMNDQWRANISRAVRGERNPHFGRPQSEAAWAAMRAASARRWQDPGERRRARGAALQWMALARAVGRKLGRGLGPRVTRCCPVCRQNFETPREGHVFCSLRCRQSPLGLQMIGAKHGAAMRGRHLSPAHREKLRVASSVAARTEDKRRAQEESLRVRCLKAAQAALRAGIDLRLDQWDAVRGQVRALGIPHVPQASVLRKFFASEEVLRESVAHYNHRVVSVARDGVEDVYDGTVDGQHNFGIITSRRSSACGARGEDFSGIFLHNSEYVFLDETACNLASINLMKFVDQETGAFDVEGYVHAVRLWTLVLEITVAMAHLPGREMAIGTHNFRTLGLGYANLGTLLMVWGVPYDTPQARAIAGALTAILTGEAYALSAEVASQLGPFPGFAQNREHMLRVIRNHRRAAYDAPREKYEGLSVLPVAIPQDLCPEGLLRAAHRAWDRALEAGEHHGYRNAQVTCIAPTGCLIGSSLVATDRGLLRLGRLGNPEGAQWQDVNFRVHTDAGLQRATKFYVNGVAPTRRVRTASGYEIQGTLQHRIRVVDQRTGEFVWKYFADVQAGDVVPLALQTIAGEPRQVPLPPLGEAYWAGNPAARAPRAVTPELAELVGYFMGDGSLHAKGIRLCVSEADGDVVEHLRGRVRELFNLEAHVSKRCGYWEVAVHSVPLLLWWEACGFMKKDPGTRHGGKGYLPQIPDAVLATNDAAVYRAFLRGLFEADGSVTAGNPSWTTAHAPFAAEVRTLLLALGFPTTTKRDISGWGKSALVVLRIKNQSYNAAYRDEIGFIGRRKTQRVRVSGLRGGVAIWQARSRDYVYLPAEVYAVAGRTTRRDALPRAERCRRGAVSRLLAREVYAETLDRRIAYALEFFYDHVSVNEDGGLQPTFDLSVPATVTYTANGFLSHNTIGLQMGCDTTGVEPDFALVKFKKLAGGGYLKIVNQSVPRALKTLGYAGDQIADIVRYISGTLSLSGENGNGPPHINHDALRAKGFTEDDLGRIEAQLPGAFHLTMAFTPAILGDALLGRLGLADQAKEHPTLNVLGALGFTPEQIEEANAVICGRQMVEGAPHVKEDHLGVFDCANKCGPAGKRFIPYQAHVQMLAAVQPFISGSISKTINMPAEATVEDVERVHWMGWQLGLKALALYRDGSKASQPLSARAGTEKGSTKVVQKVVEKVVERPRRVKLPRERQAITRKVNLAGEEFYLTVGLYPDGRPGELFITMGKEGSFASGLADAMAKMVSVGLQYGVPLDTIIRQLRHMRFAPDGFTGDPDIPTASSVADFLAQWLTKTFPEGRHTELGRLPLPEAATGNIQPGTAHTGPTAEALPATLNPQLSALNSAGPMTVSPAPGMVVTFTKQAPPPGYGFSGDKCGDCGSLRMVQSGTCKKCMDCGSTTGCS